jgi:hypothetical protein
MKGIVFTEFLEMVEDRFSPEVADRIIEASDLPSGGIYTAVGTYDHQEMIQLVSQLSAVTGIAVPELLRLFGQYLFGRFVDNYPRFFTGVESTFAFLHNIDQYIHVEVQKLYPDAELPHFAYDTSQPGCLSMIYQSTRPFASLAEGLIMGCIAHFQEQISIQCEDLSYGQGTCARFVLTKQE